MKTLHHARGRMIPSRFPRLLLLGAILLAAPLTGCRGRYDLVIERTDEDEDRSCTAICYDAVTSAETQEDGSTDGFDLYACEDDESDDDRIVCHFRIPE